MPDARATYPSTPWSRRPHREPPRSFEPFHDERVPEGQGDDLVEVVWEALPKLDALLDHRRQNLIEVCHISNASSSGSPPQRRAAIHAFRGANPPGRRWPT